MTQSTTSASTRGRKPLTILLVVLAVALGMTVAGVYDLAPRSYAESNEDLAVQVEAGDSGHLPNFAELADAVSGAVVSIQAVKVQEPGEGVRNPFELFLDPRNRQPQPQPRREGRRNDSSGSGFLISSGGLVVTNHHVIDNADSLIVHRGDEEFEATVVGDDPATDLALLQIDTDREMPYLELADSDRVRVGDWLMVIGSPMQLQNSVSVGVVSAKGRSINITPDRSLENFIQTDAAINFGNSGGPLVNLRGEVIGIATAINYGAENIGFAVPVNTLRGILPQLRETGSVSRGYLGVNIEDVEPDTARAFGFDGSGGALITEVLPDSPAQKAGLKHGDIIVGVDEVEIVDNRELIDTVSAHRPGTEVDVKVFRNGEYLTLDLTLGERPDVAQARTPTQSEEDGAIDWLGIQYRDLTPAVRDSHGIPASLQGVWVTAVAPTSPLYDENVRPNDVISEVNGEAVTSVDEFESAVEALEEGSYLRLYVSRMDPRTGNVVGSFFAIVAVE